MATLSLFLLALMTGNETCVGSAYAGAVESYRSGDYPSALERFEALGGPPDSANEADDACIATLSLLETELGAMHAAELRWAVADVYFDAAWETGSQLRDRAFRARFQRQWLLFTGLLYQDLVFSGDPAGALSRAETYLRRAVERFSTDPEVLMAAGALLEWASSKRLLDSAREAEAFYSDALRADPTLAAAHVRLGWVRLVQLDTDDSELISASLTEGLRLATQPILIYRARMGLGRLAERQGLWREAARHYEKATQVAPGWQIGHTAHAYALYRTGARAEAREILRASARIPDVGDNVLGYWRYELGSSADAEGILLRMREEVLR